MQVPALTAGSGPAMLACASVLCLAETCTAEQLPQKQEATTAAAACPQQHGRHSEKLPAGAGHSPVPGVGSLTARGLAGGDVQHLGGHAHRALHLEALVLGTLDQVSAHCRQGRNRLRQLNGLR